MSSTIFFFLFVPLLAFILLAINLIFAPHNPYQEKDSAFECGFSSFLGQNRTQFSISFFIFALLFLLFDLEILLVYPYLVSAYTNGIYGLSIMLIFLLALTLGFAFELGKKALSIDSRQTASVKTKVPNNNISKLDISSRTFNHTGKRNYSTYTRKYSLTFVFFYDIYLSICDIISTFVFSYDIYLSICDIISTFEFFYDIYLSICDIISTFKFIFTPISISSMLYSRLYDHVYSFAVSVSTPLFIDLRTRYNRRSAYFLVELLSRWLYKNFTLSFTYSYLPSIITIYIFFYINFSDIIIENGFTLSLYIVPVIFLLIASMLLKGWLIDISAQNKKPCYKLLLIFAEILCDIVIMLLLCVLVIVLLDTLNSLANFDFIRGNANNNKKSTGNYGDGNSGDYGGNDNNGGGGGPQEPHDPESAAIWAAINRECDEEKERQRETSPHGQQRRRRNPDAPIQIYPPGMGPIHGRQGRQTRQTEPVWGEPIISDPVWGEPIIGNIEPALDTQYDSKVYPPYNTQYDSNIEPPYNTQYDSNIEPALDTQYPHDPYLPYNSEVTDIPYTADADADTGAPELTPTDPDPQSSRYARNLELISATRNKNPVSPVPDKIKGNKSAKYRGRADRTEAEIERDRLRERLIYQKRKARGRPDRTEAEAEGDRLRKRLNYEKRRAKRTEAMVESDRANSKAKSAIHRAKKRGSPHFVTPPAPIRPALPRNSRSASPRK